MSIKKKGMSFIINHMLLGGIKENGKFVWILYIKCRWINSSNNGVASPYFYVAKHLEIV